ncbi:MAG: SoxR reducing system RseC family protein [Candidatus Latescibacterota bacterium]
MIETGVVIEAGSSKAKVSLRRTPACTTCTLCHKEKPESGVTEAWNPIGANVGDHVSVSVPDQGRIAGAFVLFLVPVLVLILGLILGRWASEQLGLARYASLGAAMGTLIFLVPSFLLIRWYDRMLGQRHASEVRIVEIVRKQVP